MKVIFVEDGSVDTSDLEEKTGLPVVVYRQGAKRPEIVDIPAQEGTDNSCEVLTERLKNICIRNNYVNVLKVADNCLSSKGVMSPSVPANFAKCDKCPYRNEHFCKSKLIEDLTNIVKEFILELGLAHYRFSDENKGDNDGDRKSVIDEIIKTQDHNESNEMLIKSLEDIYIKNDFIDAIQAADHCLRNDTSIDSYDLANLANIVNGVGLEIGLDHLTDSKKLEEIKHANVEIRNNESASVEKFKREIRDILNANKYSKVMHSFLVCEECKGCQGCDYEHLEDCCEERENDMRYLLEKIAAKCNYNKEPDYLNHMPEEKKND